MLLGKVQRRLPSSQQFAHRSSRRKMDCLASSMRKNLEEEAAKVPALEQQLAEMKAVLALQDRAQS